MHHVATLRGLAVGDVAAGWEAAGFAVTADRIGLGGVTIGLWGDDGDRGLLGWSLDPPAPAGVDGILHAELDEVADGAHPNGAVAVDHVVVATPDVHRTVGALESQGLPLRRTLRGARGDDDTRYAFLLAGTAVVEVIGPDVATSGGPARLVGVAVTCGDVDALGAAWSRPVAAVQPGRRIATLRRETLDVSVPVAALSPRP